MKKMLKIGIILILLISTIFIFSNQSMATGFDWKNQVSAMASSEATGSTKTSVQKIMGSMIDIVRIASTGIAIVMLTVLGIKYMIASPGDRAEIKKHAVVYVIGAVILFSTTGILSIIKVFAEGNFN